MEYQTSTVRLTNRVCFPVSSPPYNITRRLPFLIGRLAIAERVRGGAQPARRVHILALASKIQESPAGQGPPVLPPLAEIELNSKSPTVEICMQVNSLHKAFTTCGLILCYLKYFW